MKNLTEDKGGLVTFFLKDLLFSYIVTGIFLALLSLLLYKLGLGEKAVSIAIIGIYVGVTFFAGYMAGKRMGSRKFLWGALMGGMYFLVLALISLLFGRDDGFSGNHFFTTLVLCIGGGTMGGMLS